MEDLLPFLMGFLGSILKIIFLGYLKFASFPNWLKNQISEAKSGPWQLRDIGRLRYPQVYLWTF